MDIDEIGHCVAIPRRRFFEEWVKVPKQERCHALIRYVLSESNIEKIEDIDTTSFKTSVTDYCRKINQRWETCHRKKDIFIKKFSSWLEEEFKFVITTKVVTPSTSKFIGRPEKAFNECSDKSKKRKVAKLLEFDSEKLVFAAHLSLHSLGNRDGSKTVKEVINKGNGNTSAAVTIATNKQCISAEKALALFIDCRLSKATYKLLRENARENGHDLYPPYYKVQAAKKACCLPDDEIIISETRAELPLQNVLDLTVQRLCEVQYPVIKQLIGAGVLEFTLVCKWGCDGSGGHSKYKQKFVEENKSDENLFMYSFVPLQMCAKKSEIYAWKNNFPGSTRFCRPIKFILEKETTSCIVAETEMLKVQVQNLVPTIVDVDEKEVTITHQLIFRMVDGKVCNALTKTQSSQTCYICKATPKNFNSLDQALPPAQVQNYEFGLSTLHAWIRTFEYLLNLSYRLEIKKKQVRSDQEKEEKTKKKAKVQEMFKSQLGLNVDMPKQGFGNTNDGNTARRFFKESAVSASITGIDESIIKRFGTILQTLSSGYEIDPEKLNLYTSETKTLLFQLYPWYDMSPTVHKILDHSTEIVRHHLVPIGQLSEEAQEARNKDCRRFRLHNTRKHSRESTNKYLLTMLMVSSDPVVSSLRKPPTKKSTTPPRCFKIIEMQNSSSRYTKHVHRSTIV